MKKLLVIFVALLSTLLVSCKKKYYEVMFYYDQELVSSISVKHGDMIKDIPLIEKKNHVLDGWLYNNEKFEENTPVKEDMNLVANWVKVACEVIFLSDDVAISTLTVPINTVIDDVPILGKEFNDLDGWYYNNEKFDVNTPVKEDMRLVANWVRTVYIVTFVDGDTISTVNVPINATIDNIPILEKDYHEFLGWYYNDEKFDFSQPITSDIEIVAKWIDFRNKYVLGDAYTSKEDLFNNYFTDFYNYLKEFYPYSQIKNYSLPDFLEIAGSWDYGAGKMSGLADIFSKYYLIPKTDGIVENQSDAGFIGYCYNNNKYQSFIRFLITFFGYWRTDENYSSSDVNGDDFFYSAWPSLVDTCKFFYFDYETLPSYQRTDRLLSCFENVDSVVDLTTYPILSADFVLTPLTRRGYIFEGWYTDKEFKNPITELTSDMENITIYAKWKKATYTVTYKNPDGEIIKTETYEYLDYVILDGNYTYSESVQNLDSIRVLNFTEEMPIINDIILVKNS